MPLLWNGFDRSSAMMHVKIEICHFMNAVMFCSGLLAMKHSEILYNKNMDTASCAVLFMHWVIGAPTSLSDSQMLSA